MPSFPVLFIVFALYVCSALGFSITNVVYTGTYTTNTEDYAHIKVTYSYKKADPAKFAIYLYDTKSHKNIQVAKSVTKPTLPKGKTSGSKVTYLNPYLGPGTYSVKFTKVGDPSKVYTVSKATFTVNACAVKITKTLYAGSYPDCGNTAVAGASWKAKSCSPATMTAYLYSVKTGTQKHMPGMKVVTSTGSWYHCLFKKEMEGAGTYKVRFYANVTNPTKTPILATTAEWTIAPFDYDRLIVNGDGYNDA